MAQNDLLFTMGTTFFIPKDEGTTVTDAPGSTKFLTYVTGNSGTVYPVFGREDETPIGETKYAKYFLTRMPTGKMGFIKISRESGSNAGINQEKHRLERMLAAAREIDQRAGQPMTYGSYFPIVIEDFTSGDGSNRYGVVMGFDWEVMDYQSVIPGSKLFFNELGNQVNRIDLKTAIWVLGKTCKILDFAHGFTGNTVGTLDFSNIFLEPEHHGIWICDWSSGQDFSEPVPSGLAKMEVMKLGELVWQMTGGTENTQPVHDVHLLDADEFARLVEFLETVRSGVFTALEVHKALYPLADSIWPKVPGSSGRLKRQFHEWTMYEI